MQEHQFTLVEALDLLPWLEAKFAELEPYISELRTHSDKLQELFTKSRGNGSHGAGEELHRLEELVEEMKKGVNDILEQITSRGILVRDLDRGLVDFPSTKDGNEIYLCWIRGEPEIGYWHRTDEGYASRKSL